MPFSEGFRWSANHRTDLGPRTLSPWARLLAYVAIAEAATGKVQVEAELRPHCLFAVHGIYNDHKDSRIETPRREAKVPI